MRDYIDITGKTEEEAIKKGLQQLGLDRDDVSILEKSTYGERYNQNYVRSSADAIVTEALALEAQVIDAVNNNIDI